jgi:hypothetical protein
MKAIAISPIVERPEEDLRARLFVQGRTYETAA